GDLAWVQYATLGSVDEVTRFVRPRHVFGNAGGPVFGDVRLGVPFSFDHENEQLLAAVTRAGSVEEDRLGAAVNVVREAAERRPVEPASGPVPVPVPVFVAESK